MVIRQLFSAGHRAQRLKNSTKLPERRRLIIETATATCSVAYFSSDQLLAAHNEQIGRGHAERLLPLISSLPEGGRADEILVSLGPGSFTGIRVGLAVARALGLAWRADVCGYGTLSLLAHQAFDATQAEALTVAQIGGHGEFFVQTLQNKPFAATTELVSLPIAEAVKSCGELVVGSAAETIIRERGWGRALTLTPCAANAAGLPMRFRSMPPVPLYGRDADARPMV